MRTRCRHCQRPITTVNTGRGGAPEWYHVLSENPQFPNDYERICYRETRAEPEILEHEMTMNVDTIAKKCVFACSCGKITVTIEGPIFATAEGSHMFFEIIKRQHLEAEERKNVTT